jgi:hypothetical protein
MYQIAIDNDNGDFAHTQEEAEVAVAGTDIVVKELTGMPGTFLAELPAKFVDEMRHYGSFDVQNGEWYIHGEEA